MKHTLFYQIIWVHEELNDSDIQYQEFKFLMWVYKF